MKYIIRMLPTASTQSQHLPHSLRNALLTTVGVNEFGLRKAHSEVVEHRGLVQVAEGREVILTHEDVRVAERRQTLGINGIIQLLCKKIKPRMFVFLLAHCLSPNHLPSEWSQTL